MSSLRQSIGNQGYFLQGRQLQPADSWRPFKANWQTEAERQLDLLIRSSKILHKGGQHNVLISGTSGLFETKWQTAQERQILTWVNHPE